jgi:hypothetical protein
VGSLLDVMRGFRFGNKWWDLVYIVLASASSRVLLNDFSKDDSGTKEG